MITLLGLNKTRAVDVASLGMFQHCRVEVRGELFSFFSDEFKAGRRNISSSRIGFCMLIAARRGFSPYCSGCKSRDG